MGRARHIARREGQRNRLSAQGRSHFLVFSTHHTSSPASSSPTQTGDGEPTPSIVVTSLSLTPATAEELSQLTSVPPVEADSVSASGSGSIAVASDHQGSSYNSRYKESISKSTRGWKERWFFRNTSMSDLGSEVRREVNAGIATMSRLMEHLETRDSNRTSGNFAPSYIEDGSVPGSNNQQLIDTEGGSLLRDNNTKGCCAAGSTSN